MIGRLIGKVRHSRGSRIPNDSKNCSGASARLAEVADRRARYLKAVESGDRAFPASERVRRGQKNSSIREIWEDTRLEALNYLWSFGPETIQLLVDDDKQNNLLGAYFDIKLCRHFDLQITVPSSVNSKPTVYYTVWLSILNAYSHLVDVGWEEVCRNESNRKVHILEDMNKRIHKLHKSRMEKAMMRNRFFSKKSKKAVLFDVIYVDITNKSKDIAIAARLGPKYLEELDKFKNESHLQLKQQGKSDDYIVSQLRKLEKIENQLLSANDPDDLL